MGYDVDPRAIRWSRSKYRAPNLRFVQSEDPSIPEPAQSVGLLTAFEVIEHLSEAHVDVFLNEARRILRPDGVLVGSTPNAAVHCEDSAFHLKEYTAGELEELLRAHGFTLELYGQRPGSGGSEGVLGALIQRLPPRVARWYLMRILGGLLVAVRTRRGDPTSPEGGVDRFDSAGSAHVVFVARKAAKAT